MFRPHAGNTANRYWKNYAYRTDNRANRDPATWNGDGTAIRPMEKAGFVLRRKDIFKPSDDVVTASSGRYHPRGEVATARSSSACWPLQLFFKIRARVTKDTLPNAWEKVPQRLCACLRQR